MQYPTNIIPIIQSANSENLTNSEMRSVASQCPYVNDNIILTWWNMPAVEWMVWNTK